MTEPNIYVENLDYKHQKGIEIGISYHSSQNMVAYNGMDYPPTRTSGGEYGLDKVLTPIYKAGHNGGSLTFNYKIYYPKLRKFIGPQFTVAYKELKNGYYSNHDYVGPSTQRGYYWYTANHSSYKLGILLNYGLTRGIGYRRFIFELGGAMGLSFNYDKLTILDWGTVYLSPDPYFIANYPTYKKTNQTNGFYLTPALRLYMKFGIGVSR